MHNLPTQFGVSLQPLRRFPDISRHKEASAASGYTLIRFRTIAATMVASKARPKLGTPKCNATRVVTINNDRMENVTLRFAFAEFMASDVKAYWRMVDIEKFT